MTTVVAGPRARLTFDFDRAAEGVQPARQLVHRVLVHAAGEDLESVGWVGSAERRSLLLREAAARMARRSSGSVCLGHHFGGLGLVEAMSRKMLPLLFSMRVGLRAMCLILLQPPACFRRSSMVLMSSRGMPRPDFDFS